MNTKLLLITTIGIILSIQCPIHAENLVSSKEKRTLNVVETNTVISNSQLSVSYNPQSKMTEVIVLASNKAVVKNLMPNGTVTTVMKNEISNSKFGKGKELVFNTKEGSSFSFTLYDSVPFVFVKQTVTNSEKDILDIQKLNPVTFTVDLQKQASELKTLGTGGLLEVDKNPGSYVFLTTVNPSNRNGVVTGWLTNEKGSGVVFSDIKNNLTEIKAQIDYGHLRIPSGKSEQTETLLIRYFDDARIGEENFADLLAKHNSIELKKRSAVYCTWYSEKNGGAGNESSTIELAKFTSKNLKQFGLGVIQIDDQWQDGGIYNGPTRGFDRVRKVATQAAAINGTATGGFPAGYPNGMTTVAQAIKQYGFTAGIWWMPFARNHQDPEYKDRQDWFAYRTNGKPYETVWGGTSLDLTNPKVQNHIAGISKTMKSWGYNYFKMDGLWTGTVTEQVYINDGYKNDSIGNCKPLFDPLKSQIQAFRDGLKLIRTSTDGQVFLSGCCVSQNMRSLGASIGLVDAMRVGPDYNHDGQSIRTGPLRASRLYFLNGRIWWNDPDPSVIRETGASIADKACNGIGSLTRARLLPSFVAVSGQLFLSSDWIPDLPQERIEIMKRCMAYHSGEARPVDAFDKNLPAIWLASDTKTGTERNVVGLYNWETTTQKIESTTAWIGLKGKSYYAFDFWANKPIDDVSSVISQELEMESCKVLAVREKSNHPVVVSTSQHITQGMIDLLKEEWKNGQLSVTSKLIAGDDYEVRIAGLNDGASWQLNKALLIGNPENVSITVLPTVEKGWIRILIKSKITQTVKWRVDFDKK